MKSIKRFIQESLNESNKFDHGFWNKVPKFIKKMLNKHGRNYDIPAVIVSRPVQVVPSEGWTGVGHDMEGIINGETLFSRPSKLMDEINDYISVVYKAYINRVVKDEYSESGLTTDDICYSFDDDVDFEDVKKRIHDKFIELCKEYCPEGTIKDEMNYWDNRGMISVEINDSGFYMYPEVSFCW